MAAWRNLGALFGSSNLRGHFGGEIVHPLFDTLAHHIQGKAMDRRSAAFEHLFYRLLIILHKALVQVDMFQQFVVHS